jgi:hypothetical protein
MANFVINGFLVQVYNNVFKINVLQNIANLKLIVLLVLIVKMANVFKLLQLQLQQLQLQLQQILFKKRQGIVTN